MTGEGEELARLRQRLEEIAEELAMLALDRLRDAARVPASDSAPLAAAERRVTRARRRRRTMTASTCAHARYRPR